MAVRLHLGIGVHDRGRALAEGEVHVDGLDLEVTRDASDGGLHRRFLEGSFDACEYSFGAVVQQCGQDRDFLALPIFPARKFRHSLIYVAAASKISSPTQLVGRRVGINSWDNTAAVWSRAMLQHDFGVDLDSVEWVAGSLPKNELLDRIKVAGITVTPAEHGVSIKDQLLEGRLDALISTSVINDPRATRLFPDYRTVERDYFSRTQILPIGHAVVVRREICELNPLVPKLLIAAWEQSKEIAEQYETHANHSNLMWYAAYEDEERALFGDPFTFNLEDHRPTLEAFMTYAYEQCLTPERREVEGLFV